jgi:hypothetical protein
MCQNATAVLPFPTSNTLHLIWIMNWIKVRILREMAVFWRIDVLQVTWLVLIPLYAKTVNGVTSCQNVLVIFVRLLNVLIYFDVFNSNIFKVAVCSKPPQAPTNSFVSYRRLIYPNFEDFGKEDLTFDRSIYIFLCLSAFEFDDPSVKQVVYECNNGKWILNTGFADCVPRGQWNFSFYVYFGNLLEN